MIYKKIGVVIVMVFGGIWLSLCVVNDSVEFIEFYCVMICVFFFNKGINRGWVEFEYCKSNCEMCKLF